MKKITFLLLIFTLASCGIQKVPVSASNILDDVGLSRTHSGLNYQLSVVDVREELGRAVGEAVNSLNFRN